jgi:hypothetical protein
VCAVEDLLVVGLQFQTVKGPVEKDFRVDPDTLGRCNEGVYGNDGLADVIDLVVLGFQCLAYEAQLVCNEDGVLGTVYAPGVLGDESISDRA